MLSPDVMPGVVMAPSGHRHRSNRKGATVHALTPPAFADLGRGPTFSDVLVQVGKISTGADATDGRAQCKPGRLVSQMPDFSGYRTMADVVTDSCRGCRFTECVTVCPVECFHVDDTMTYIDPENCIDCGGCVPVLVRSTPSNRTIVLLPTRSSGSTSTANLQPETPVLTARLPPLPGADVRRQEIGR